LALRTQQILAEETGVADTADPLAGSYFVERLTDELEAAANDWIAKIEECGGAVAAIEDGFMQNAIAENAYRRELAREMQDEVVVGVNKYAEDENVRVPIQKIDQEITARQIERTAAYKHAQDRELVRSALARVEVAARDSDNLLPPMKSALQSGATHGQIADRLRAVFGEHRPG
jgi:methylmalonyl-CoA mutase N-terminal domain/subunit